MVKIAYLNFNKQFSESTFNILLKELPQELQKKTMKYYRWQDRYASLFGKHLLKELLLTYGFNDDCLSSLKKTAFGRLYIDDHIDFNISHSGTNVVCAMSDSLTVGIDVEEVKAIDINDFKPFLRGEEWDALIKSSSLGYDFYSLWTRKESLIKADGRGLSIDLTDVKVYDEKGIIVNEPDKNTWHFQKLDQKDDAVMHLCTNSENIDIKYIEEETWSFMTR